MNTGDERQYLDDEQARHLYRNDQTFRQLVDCMVALIRRLELTPGEARSAATFAAIVHESRYPKPAVYLSYGYFDKAAQEEMLRAMQYIHQGRQPSPEELPQKLLPL